MKAQEEENWIKTVKDAIKSKNSLDKESIRRNSFQLKGLMQEFKHLLVGSDNSFTEKLEVKKTNRLFSRVDLNHLYIKSYM